MTSNPRRPGNEPDPDTTDPTNDVANHGTDKAEGTDEDGVPLGADFA